MANEYNPDRHHYQHRHHVEEIPIEQPAAAVEATDRGVFGFMKKKEEDDKVIVDKFEKVQTSEGEPKVEYAEEDVKKDNKKKNKLGGVLHKIHGPDSSSSSSSDEEGEDKEKKKEKKEKKKKDEKKSFKVEKDDAVAKVVVKEEVIHSDPSHTEEKKPGLLEKVKEKLPGGQHKIKAEEFPAPPPPHPAQSPEPELETFEVKEKKGFLEKIKEKIPGFNKHEDEEEEKKEEKKKEEKKRDLPASV